MTRPTSQSRQSSSPRTELTPPTFRSLGAVGTGAPLAGSVAEPAGIATGDLDVMIASTDAGGSITITTAGGGAWTALPNSPIDVTSGEKLYIWYRIRAGGDGAPTLTAGSDHFVAHRFAVVAGTFDSTTPIEIATSGSEATADTSFSFAPGNSTSEDDCMLVVACSSGVDSAVGQAGTNTANSNLSSINMRAEPNTATGGGGGFWFATAELLVAGAVGTWTQTMTTLTPKAYLNFAIRPTPLDTGVINCRQRNAQATVSATSGASPAWGKPTLAGSLLLIVVNEYDAFTGAWATPPSGWTAVSPSPSIYNSTLTNAFGIFWKIAAGSDATPPSIGADGGASPWMIYTFEFTAPNGWVSSAFDKEAHSASSATSAASKASGSTATLSQTMELAVAVAALTLAGTAFSYTNGYVEEAPPAGTGVLSFAWKQTSATTAESTTASWTTSRVAGCRVATFKAQMSSPQAVTFTSTGTGTSSFALKVKRALGFASTGTGTSAFALRAKRKLTFTSNGVGKSTFVLHRRITDGGNYLNVPASGGASTPNQAGLAVGQTTLELIWGGALDDYTAVGHQSLLSHYGGGGGGTRWWLGLLASSGIIEYDFYNAGGSFNAQVAAPGWTDGTTRYLRVVHDVLAGVVDFYHSTDGDAWSLLSHQTGFATTTQDTSGTPLLYVNNDGSSEYAQGKVFRTQVYVNGSMVVDMDWTRAAAGAGTWTATTGEVWTRLGTSTVPSTVRALTFTSTGTGTSSFSLKAKRALTFSSTGTGTTAFNLNRYRPLTFASNGVGTSSFSLKAKRALTFTSAGVGTSTWTALKYRGVAFTSTGTGTSAFALTVKRAIAFSSTGTGTTSFSLKVKRTLAFTSAGTGTSAFALKVKRALNFASTGTGTSVFSLGRRRPLTFSSAGTGTSTFSLGPLQSGVWYARHETGDYSEWDLGGYGGHQDDPGATSVIDTAHAHSGKYSLKMSIDTTAGQMGTRNFRWALDAAGTPLSKKSRYTCWYYFPTVVTPGGFWSIMQWKTKALPSGSDPDWMVDIWLDGANGMRLYMWDAHNSTDHGGGYSPPNALTLNTWHRVDVDYTWDETNGSVVAYLNGVQWFSMSGVATQWPTLAAPSVWHWSINSYADNNSPAATDIWADDASVVSWPYLLMYSEGVGTSSFSLKAKRALTFSSTGTGTSAFSLKAKRAFAFTSAGTGTSAFSLKAKRALAFTSTGSGTSSFALGAKRALAFSSPGVGTTTFTLRAKRALSFSSTGTGASTFTLLAKRALSFSSPGVGTSAFSLKARRALTFSSPGVGTTSFSLKAKRAFSFQSTGTGASSFVLAAKRALTFASTGVGTSSFVISSGLTIIFTSPGVGTSSFSIKAKRALTFASTGTGTTTFALRAKRAFSFSSAGTGTSTFVLHAKRALAFSSTGVGTTSFVIHRRATLTLTSSGIGTSSFILHAKRALSFNSTGSGSTSFNLARIRALTFTSDGNSTSEFTLTAIRALEFSSLGIGESSFSLTRIVAVTPARMMLMGVGS